MSSASLRSGIELLLFAVMSVSSTPISSPTMARAEIARGETARRSSTPSPTPMKCTGRPNFAAIATRMPPRAVPSSLVMTRPVTPAILPKISTWVSAFWPTVASSTSSTACGAVGSTFFITRTIFSSSPISSARFCRRPAVSTSSTSTPSRLRGGERVEGKAGRIGARLARDHAGAGALAPDFQLLDGGGAEGVAGRQHHRLAFGAELARRACRWSWSCRSR